MKQNDTIRLSTKNVIGSGGYPNPPPPPPPPPPRLYNGAGVRLNDNGKIKGAPDSVIYGGVLSLCAFLLLVLGVCSVG